ncbi:S41 family peptidase [Pedobacter aquatilis]|uniref:S41 family peptidase n=1 Tax=Pedobacter aquatilis TaxID=351343 RepID=UPI002930AE27|nr:S41 family peptidase [Pedobacter aquatilis]
MKKGFFLGFSLLLNVLCYAQNRLIKLKANVKEQQFFIRQNEKASFEVDLDKQLFYRIAVQQQGIDLVFSISDAKQNLIAEVDSPTGKFGLEKTTFSPDTEGKFLITVKPLKQDGNSAQGNYTIRISTVRKKLKQFNKMQLQEDFDILKNAYIETKVGLWYNSYAEFDSISGSLRNKITDRMTAWDFYKILAPLTTYTKEGHSAIATADETNDFFVQYGTYFPFFVKIIDKKVYVLNDYQKLKTRGMIISKINGRAMGDILDTFTQIEPADGYNFTSKYKWIEPAFSKYLLRFYGLSKHYNVEFENPSDKAKSMQTIKALTFKNFNQLRKGFNIANPDYYGFTKPVAFTINGPENYAVLTINTFGAGEYVGRKEGFKKYLDSVFLEINDKKIGNLVIDIRKNEGGNQGMEDILLSYLITKPYHKYESVEVPSFKYSFLEYTDYNNEDDILKKELSYYFQLHNSGRFINKPDRYQGMLPSNIHFAGKLFVMISGLTFSGGSEFAALAKNYTAAKFVGEETGGGYYGNTSGSFLKFSLPNTQITGRIPLFKFLLNTHNDTIPFGRGVIPDVTFTDSIDDILNHRDTLLDITRSLIRK